MLEQHYGIVHNNLLALWKCLVFGNTTYKDTTGGTRSRKAYNYPSEVEPRVAIVARKWSAQKNKEATRKVIDEYLVISA